jgi:integrase
MTALPQDSFGPGIHGPGPHPQPDEDADAPQILKLFNPQEPYVPPRPKTLRDVWTSCVKPDLDEPAKKTLGDYETVLRHWEKLMKDPPIEAVNRETLKEFQAKLLAGKNSPNGHRSPATVNKLFRILKPLIRHCWPKDAQNPAGLGACDYFKFPKAVAVQLRLPTVLDDDTITKLFKAAAGVNCPGRHAPRPAVDLWRAYLVLHLNTGARTFDLLGWRWSQVDWSFRCGACTGAISFTAQKTGKLQRIPLNATCVAALRRIEHTEEFVWPTWQRHNATHMRRSWRKLCQQAGVDCRMEDFRKTCNTRHEELRPGMGQWVLGHALNGVNARNYMNPTKMIGDAMAAFPQPHCITEWIREAP